MELCGDSGADDDMQEIDAKPGDVRGELEIPAPDPDRGDATSEDDPELSGDSGADDDMQENDVAPIDIVRNLLMREV